MKKTLFILLAMILSSSAFMSCSKDDDTLTQNTEEGILFNAIVGTWKLTEFKESQSGSYVSWPYEDTYATFNSDGTYHGAGSFGTDDGTWKGKGSTVETYIKGNLYVTYEILSVSSSVAELKMSFVDGTLWIKCKKQ